MQELNENEIGKLLRLKRYEQPAPDYFENFLHEFHRRQRDELVRQPLWRICLQRAHDFMFSLNVPALSSYPVAATAVLICAAVLTLRVYETPKAASDYADSQPSALVSDVSAPATASNAAWSLSSSLKTRGIGSALARNVRESAYAHRASAQPRYVLDTVPVSYEAAFGF